MLVLAALYVASFLLGSIPFGFLVAKAKGIDIRTAGSGNIGATNVSRVLGSKAGSFVFALDVLKGVIPVLVARSMFPEPTFGLGSQVIWFLAGAMALLGHVFSPWLGFKGGKGIATALGALLAAAPPVGIIGLVVFLAVTVPTRYVSLGSILAAASLPISGWFLPGQDRELVPIYFVLAVLVILKHRPNIDRLKSGTESKFSFGNRGAKDGPP